MRINAVILFVILCLLPGACVQEVDFSGAFEKKVVVHCVIHSVAAYYPYSHYTPSAYYKQNHSTAPQQQYLYMYFNSPDGEKESLPSATARLYDNDTGDLIGTFSRVSDWEWHLAYEVPFELLEEEVKQYSLNLRLEITGIPGVDQPIIGETRLERTIAPNNVQWLRRYFAGKAAIYYSQNQPVPTPAWMLSESFYYYNGISMPGAPLNAVPTNQHAIKTSYPYADAFNYSGGTYQYGIRVLPENQSLERFAMDMEGLDTNGGQSGTGNDARFFLSYVSEEYDRYLREAIVYRMRHDTENDPLKHLYEDQVYSNIDGGIGVFGAEAIVYFCSWLDNGGW